MKHNQSNAREAFRQAALWVQILLCIPVNILLSTLRACLNLLASPLWGFRDGVRRAAHLSYDVKGGPTC